MRKRNFFSARSKAVVALRASLPEWRGERSIRDNQKRNVIPYYGAWSCTLRSTNRMEKNKWRRRRKKNRVRCKNAGLQPHSHSTNPFLRSKKGKWRRRQKKIKGYGTSASAASETFKISSFQSFGRSGGRARGPQKCPKIPGFYTGPVTRSV